MASLAEAIAQMEGWNKSGSRAQRNNNPGNLRASSLAIGKDDAGYAIFPSADVGWQALIRQIGLDTARGKTLSQFLKGYAPPSENNTSNYIQYVASTLGVSPNTALQDLGDSTLNFTQGVSSSVPDLNISDFTYESMNTGFMDAIYPEGENNMNGALLPVGIALGVLLIVGLTS